VRPTLADRIDHIIDAIDKLKAVAVGHTRDSSHLSPLDTFIRTIAKETKP
jgi:hypothetical protein